MGRVSPPIDVAPGPPATCACAPGAGRTGWLSLDEGDNDLTRFLNYFVAALQTIEGNVGQGLLGVLQSAGAVNVEAVLTTLINEISARLFLALSTVKGHNEWLPPSGRGERENRI